MATRKTTKSPMETTYPNLWRFFEGAFQANSGGHARDSDFAEFSLGQLMQAEEELSEFCGSVVDPHWLGAMADQGYTLSGQTHQNWPEDIADDEQHTLLAFELLTERY